jgi:hypothetical protein
MMSDQEWLALVAVMTYDVVTGRGIMDRMRSRCTACRGDALRASHMQRRLADNLGAKTKTSSAVMAFVVGHRAQRVALGMIAGSTARSPGHSGRWNNDDAHGFILAVCSAVARSSPASRPFSKLELLTLSSKFASL